MRVLSGVVALAISSRAPITHSTSNEATKNASESRPMRTRWRAVCDPSCISNTPAAMAMLLVRDCVSQTLGAGEGKEGMAESAASHSSKSMAITAANDMSRHAT